MAKRFIRTTQQSTVDDRGRPFETVQEREVVRTVQDPGAVRVYEPGSTLPDYYRPGGQALATSVDLASLGSRLQAQENWARQQWALLSDADNRLARIQETNRVWASAQSVEQATWWAMWGIMMLILGSALAVIVVLILEATVH